MPTLAERQLHLVDGAADLEAALAAAETCAAAETDPAETTALETTAAETTAAETTAAETAPEPPAAGDDQAAGHDQAAARAVPAAGSTTTLPAVIGRPPSLRVGRPVLIDALKDRLPGRQISWTAWSALTGAVAAATGLASTQPLLTLAACLGVGAWAAFPRRVGRGPLLLAAAVATALLVGLALAHDPTLIVAGPELLAAGAVVGAGLSFLDGAPADTWRRLHGALGGAAAAGLGLWVAAALTGSPVGTSAAGGALHGAVLGLVASQSLVASAIAWVEADRIPSLSRIRATLSPPYREPCERAWRLDQGFARQAPDRESRDGLGEVAAWVYRLQWSLQSLDRELHTMDESALVERRVSVLDRAAEADDDFTRQQLLATAEHLSTMQGHYAALARERDRSEAMREYASAFLEEARAGLALAHVQPGEHVPERLGPVLERLRTHAAEADAHRRTVREVSVVG